MPLIFLFISVSVKSLQKNIYAKFFLVELKKLFFFIYAIAYNTHIYTSHVGL